MGGFKVGSVGRDLKRKDGEVNTFKERNVKIRLSGVMYGHGCCLTVVSQGDSFIF